MRMKINSNKLWNAGQTPGTCQQFTRYVGSAFSVVPYPEMTWWKSQCRMTYDIKCSMRILLAGCSIWPHGLFAFPSPEWELSTFSVSNKTYQAEVHFLREVALNGIHRFGFGLENNNPLIEVSFVFPQRVFWHYIHWCRIVIVFCYWKSSKGLHFIQNWNWKCLTSWLFSFSQQILT